MKVNYNKQGKERKELVKAIETITGEKAVYMKMPTCNYEIGKFTVTKDGGLECEDQDLLDQMVIGLITEGFTPEGMPNRQEQTEEADTTGLTVEIPLDKVAVGNLTKILDAKGNLIKKALGISDLRFEIKEDRIAIPLVQGSRAGRGDGLHQVHRGPLQDGKGRQADHGNGEGSRE